MQKEFLETEIKNFLGISTRRNPQKNECADCQNFDLRNTDGDLIAADGLVSYLTAPDFAAGGFTWASNLGFINHVFSQLPIAAPVTKDCIFYFQKGTVGAYPHIAIGMRPYWNWSAWIDSWFWLNKVVVSKMSSISSYVIQVTNLISDTDQYLFNFAAVYNVTKQQWATITSSLGTGMYNITRSGWNTNDDVIVMRGYDIFGTAGAYFTAKSSIDWSNISFHRVINDLRIGWGSGANRIATGVSYKKHYFQIDTLSNGDSLTNVTNFDDIFSAPYNILSDSGTFAIDAGDASYGVTPSKEFPKSKITYIRLKMTAVMDNLNEYVVLNDTDVTTSDPDNIVGGALLNFGAIWIRPTIRFATMNKRVTKIRIWVACSKTTERIEDYKLIKEIDIAKSVALSGGSKLWTLDSSGNLILTEVTDLVDSDHYFQLDYQAYLGATETQALRLSDALGHDPVAPEYIQSWDQALVAGVNVYAVNPYDSKSWKNFIFNSVISGAGAPMYDVILAENYKSLDTKDGNDIVGVEINSRMEFSIFRSNGFQQYDPDNQIPLQLIMGDGAVSKLGIVNTNGEIYFPSNNYIFINVGNNKVNISEKTIRDAYKTLTTNEKAGIIATRDYDGSYRFIASYGGTVIEYIYIRNKGWIKQTDSSIVCYGHKSNGSLLCMDEDGNINEMSSTASIGSATWTSIPIDISLLGEEIKSDDRIIVGSVWAEYSTPKTLAVQLSFDGGSFSTIGTLPISKQLNDVVTNGSTDKFTLSGHGLVNNDRIVLFNITGSTGISTNFLYYVVGVSGNDFQVSLTSGGSAVNIINNGTCSFQKYSSLLIKNEVRLVPGRNAKYFQIKINLSLATGDPRTRITAIGIRRKIFKTGLYR